MKNNIGFFTHETDAYMNRKFLMLRAYYGGETGWAMEARFWALNCLIGKSAECKLDLNLKGERAVVAREIELSLSALDDFLKVLADECELLHDENGVIWTSQTQEDLHRAMSARGGSKRRRENVGRRDANELKTLGDESKTSPTTCDELKTLGDEMHGVDRSRVDKRREEKKEEPPFSFEQFSKTVSESWNAQNLKPAFRFTTSAGLTSKEREGFGVAVNRYSLYEVKQAIKNYAGISGSSDHDPFPKGYSLPGFLASGIGHYLDDADPWTRCRKKDAPEQGPTAEQKAAVFAKLKAEEDARRPKPITPLPPDEGFPEDDDEGFSDVPTEPFVFDAAKEMAKIRRNAGLHEVTA